MDKETFPLMATVQMYLQIASSVLVLPYYRAAAHHVAFEVPG